MKYVLKLVLPLMAIAFIHSSGMAQSYYRAPQSHHVIKDRTNSRVHDRHDRYHRNRNHHQYRSPSKWDRTRGLSQYLGRIPDNCRRINHAGSTFFFDRGNFYTRAHRGYRFVQPPIGLRINFIPGPNCDSYALDGWRYHQYQGVVYREMYTPRGAVYYEVVDYVSYQRPRGCR